MDPKDIPKTAIATPFGLFEFLRMHFGLKNAAQTFHQFIDQILRGFHFCYAYTDDVLIASSSYDEHVQHLQMVLERIQKYGVVINPSKCEFGVNSLVTRWTKGIQPLQEKVFAIKNFPLPNTRKQLREFLGLVNFYHRFVQNCAKILQPLNKLLSTTKDDKVQLQLNDDATAAFSAIKEALASATLLFHPKQDAPTSIMTDASSFAVGAVLQQYIEHQWCPIAYFSKKLKPSEIKYSTFNRELLAVYLAIKHFRYFVEGREFQVFTDHKPSTYSLLSNSERYTPRQIRHMDFISQFTTNIHVNGIDNPAADALSRAEINAVITPPPVIDFAEFAAAQRDDPEIKQFQTPDSSLSLKALPIPTSEGTILCDMSTGQPHPYVPSRFR